jgi:ribosomal protein S18 acetylase RimI-like enzyme
VSALRTARLAIRPAGEAHVADLQVVLEDAPAYHALVNGGPAPPDAARELLADAEADPDRRLLLVWPADGGQAAGVVDLQLHWPEPGAVHVRLLLLREPLQGRGLGREVAVAIAASLAGEGFRALRLSVTAENAGAREFWERVGFPPVDRLPAGDTLHEKLL